MKTVLCASQLNYTYTNGKEALKDVSFRVEQGRFCALLGPNGAGKSTFFSIASALLKSKGGHVEICGFDLAEKTRLALAQVGFVFQQNTLDLDLTIKQNLFYFASLQGMTSKKASVRIDEELDRLELSERRHEKIRQLNGGHKRRVEIARALLHEPSLLLLDEPTVGLDIQTRRTLVEHVHALCDEGRVGVLWATHLIDEIRDDDDVVILHKGKICKAGKSSEIGENSLEQTFNHLTQGRA